MRDAKRIRILLDKFGDLWEKFPDMRFFQVLNLIDFEYKGDFFFLEDDKTLDAIEKTLEKYSKRVDS